MKRFMPASTTLFAALLTLSPAWADPPGGKETLNTHAKGGYHREVEREKSGARIHWREERRHHTARHDREENLQERRDILHDRARFPQDDITVILNWGAGRSDRMRGDGWGPMRGPSPAALPPGLARQLQERGHLPPGLEKRSLPPVLSQRLSPVPFGYERVIVGRDVLMIETATGTIADIIRNVF